MGRGDAQRQALAEGKPALPGHPASCSIAAEVRPAFRCCPPVRVGIRKTVVSTIKDCIPGCILGVSLVQL